MEKARGEGFSPSDKEARALELSKDKLKRDAEKVITGLFDSVLDLAEVAIDGEARFKVFRGKVLRFGNDAIRDLKRVLDKDYQVLYTPSNEDVVEIQKPRIQPRKSAEG